MISIFLFLFSFSILFRSIPKFLNSFDKIEAKPWENFGHHLHTNILFEHYFMFFFWTIFFFLLAWNRILFRLHFTQQAQQSHYYNIRICVCVFFWCLLLLLLLSELKIRFHLIFCLSIFSILLFFISNPKWKLVNRSIYFLLIHFFFPSSIRKFMFLLKYFVYLFTLFD